MTRFLKRYPSLVGFIALITWSFSALLGSSMNNIPIFEMLSIIFFVSFVSIFGKVSLFHEWHKLKQPLIMTFAGIAGIYGNDFFYFEAFKYAPATQVDLINYLWPVFVMLLSGVFSKEKMAMYQKFGCLVSFFGVYVLIAYDANMPFKQSFLHGYVYALLDALIWALYVLMCRRYKELHSEMVGVYCFIGMVLSLGAHSVTEAFVSPSVYQWFIMIVIGVFSQGMAYVLWEKGIKQGNFALLTTCSYFTPILSITVLVVFSKAHYSHTLLIATLLVTSGALITNYSKN